MTISVSQISNTQSFGTWLQRTNDIATIISSNTVTTDSTTGGSITTGRGFVNGAFGANTIYVTTITAGNLSVNGSLVTITSNLAVNATASIGNSTVNAQIGWIAGSQAIQQNFASDNNFIQVIIQNLSNGTNASGDLVINSDTANDTAGFIDLGINSKNYSNSSFSITDAGEGYLYTANTGMAIGTATAKPLKFFVGGTTSADEKMRLTSGGNVAIGATTADATLKVTGTANVTGNVTVVGALTVNSAANIVGAVALSNTISVAGAANLQSTVNVGSTLSVVGNVTLSSNLSVNGAVSLANNLTVTGVTNVATFNTSGLANLSNMNTNVANVANVNVTDTARIGTINSTSNGVLANTTQISIGNTSVNTIITPTSLTTNSISAYNFFVTGTIVGAFSANGNILPYSNDSIYIGVSSNVFAQAYVTNVYSNAIYSYSGTLNVISNTAITGTLTLNGTKQIVTNTYTFSSTSLATVDSFSASAYRSAEYTVQAVDAGSGSYHFSKLLVTHDGTTAYIAEFGVITNLGNIVSFVVDVNAGNVRLRGTPTASGIVVKFSRDTMAV